MSLIEQFEELTPEQQEQVLEKAQEELKKNIKERQPA